MREIVGEFVQGQPLPAGVQVGAQGVQPDARYLRSDGSKMSFAERRRQIDVNARVEKIAAADTVAVAAGRDNIEYDPE